MAFGALNTGTVLGPEEKQRTKQSSFSWNYSLLERQRNTNEQSHILKLVNENYYEKT